VSAIHDRIAGVLRESDGLDLGEIIELCGDGLGERVTPKWWEDRVHEMAQHGYTIAEDRGVFILVAEREAAA
jgi:hypothetical protein